jgi:hypothetical protein
MTAARCTAAHISRRGFPSSPFHAPLLEKCNMSELAISPKWLFVCKETKVRALRFTEQLSDLTLHRKTISRYQEGRTTTSPGEAHASKTFHGVKRAVHLRRQLEVPTTLWSSEDIAWYEYNRSLCSMLRSRIVWVDRDDLEVATFCGRLS